MSKRNIKSFDQWSERHVSIYTQARVQHLISKNPKAKPYLFDNLRKLIANNFRFTAPLCFMRYKSIISKVVNVYAKTFFTENPNYTKSANVFEWSTIKLAASELVKTGWKGTMAALILLFTHTVGCRASEALNLYWEDFEKENNENGKFWKWRVRVSKNNQLALNQEQLTYKRHPSKRIFETIYKNYHRTLGRPNVGRMFPQSWGKTTNVNYQLTKISKKLGLAKKISCHSGRHYCTNLLIVKEAPPQSIRCTLRWSPNSKMIDRYRSKNLETSKIGGANYLEVYQ